MRKRERGEREALVGAYADSDFFVRERWKVEGAVVISVVDIVCVVVILSVGRVCPRCLRA